jgi:hypothetical protein
VKEKYTGSLHKMVIIFDRDHLEINNRKFGAYTRFINNTT